MNLLITGAKGFIGSCLTARATMNGHGVIALDDLSRGLNDVQSVRGPKFIAFDCREGIAPILDEYESPAEYSSPLTHAVGVGRSPIQAVIHLAAGTGSLSRPYEELCELNIEMTKRIYKDAVARGIKVFVFPTTSLVEGVPDAPYVKSKQDAMDWLCAQDDDIRLVPLQFYNVTGAYNGFSEHRKLEVHIIPIMLECFMNDKPFVINGGDYDTVDGTPGRDFSNVIDVCDMILKLTVAQLYFGPLKITKPIKIGTGVVTTTQQMVQLFNSYMENRRPDLLKTHKLETIIGPRRPYDCGWLRCDQPYLHCAMEPTGIATSLRQELDTLLRVVYKV